jgi:hypothetical protein
MISLFVDEIRIFNQMLMKNALSYIFVKEQQWSSIYIYNREAQTNNTNE